MCGIGGVVVVSGSGAANAPATPNIPDFWLDAIDARIAHRGPDGAGRFRDSVRREDGSIVEVALVHRRLSIIDPAGGAQPMLSPSEPHAPDLHAIVFNGCIYNHRDLRRELGSDFRTDHSDTEVLLRGFRSWGARAFERAEGMFALAIWSRAAAQLTLARDRAGEKPLYAANLNSNGCEVFAFASTTRALIALARAINPGWMPAIDAARMTEWIGWGFSRHPPVKGFASVLPSTVVTGPHAAGEPWRSQRFAQLPRRDPARILTAPEVERILEASVAARLEADVPLGCFLSGGIDSPLVAAYARRHAPSLRTFTVRMPDRRYDESEAARQIARRLGTRHATLDCRPAPAEDLPHLIHELGMPLGDSSLLPTHWVSRAAREHVSVALGGDGGDELFMGYERYRAAGWLRNWRQLLALIPSVIADGEHRSKRSKLARLGAAARGLGYADLLAVFPSEQLLRLLGPGAPAPEFAADPVTDPMRFDFEHYLPGDLLRKVDAASMSVALEVRSPMLDSRLIEAGLSAATASLCPEGRTKGLLRRIALRHLPRELVDRPKRGFSIPVGEWFRSDFGGMKRLLLRRMNDPKPFGRVELGVTIQPAAVQRLLAEHASGRRDHGQRLFSLLSLSIWTDLFR